MASNFCLAILRIFAKASKNRGLNSLSNRRSPFVPGIDLPFYPKVARAQYQVYIPIFRFARSLPGFSGPDCSRNPSFWVVDVPVVVENTKDTHDS